MQCVQEGLVICSIESVMQVECRDAVEMIGRKSSDLYGLRQAMDTHQRECEEGAIEKNR